MAHIGDWELEPKTHRLTWSDEVYRICEIERRAFGGTYDDFLRIVHPDDREDIHAKLSTAIRIRTPLITVHRLLMTDGRVKFVQERAEMVLREDGRVRRVRGTLQDVTERRHIEDRMQKSLALLERAGRINTLGEMATTIAHELNQPLMAIGNYAGGAIQRLHRTKDGDPVLLQALERIAQITQRSGDIIASIRGFVGKHATEKMDLDLNTVIRDSLFLARPEARRNNLVIQEDLQDDLPMVHGAFVNLQQVIVNLVLNAVEASGDTPADLRAIRVATGRTEGSQVEITVADYGSGLPAEVVAHLFQPFMTTKAEGVGMGLSIVRTIVDDHQGRIWARPNEPCGTVFRIRLPPASERET
jgi:C4-dicarboxylate-specific signal transduction histidine kinase